MPEATAPEQLAPPPAPMRFRTSGRRADTPRTFANPLPPLLLERVAAGKRRHHETMLKRFTEAEAEVVELTERFERQRIADDEALRKALTRGGKPPAPKAPALEEKLTQARVTMETAGELVAESGRGLLADLNDADLQAALKTADEREREITATLPGQVAAVTAELQRLGAIADQAFWISGLLEQRYQAPYNPNIAFPSTQLRQARSALGEAEGQFRAHLTEQEWRDQGPPKHHPPRMFAPEPEQVTPGYVTGAELPQVAESATVPVPSSRPADAT
jgi:hypothetical protein